MYEPQSSPDPVLLPTGLHHLSDQPVPPSTEPPAVVEAGSIEPAQARQELDAALSASGAAQRLRALDRVGRLDALLPELRPMKGCEQPKEHYWDVFDHTIETVAAVDRIVDELPALAEGRRPGSGLSPASAAWLLAELSRPLAEGADPLRLTRWSALLHDVAKPATKSLQPDGRTRFFGHPELGAQMTREILGRLGYRASEIDFVARLVDMHLRPGQLGFPEPSDRAVRRFFRDAVDGAAGLLVLNLADHAAALGPRLIEADWNYHLAAVDGVIARRDVLTPPPPPVRLVTGHDLMQHLQIPPGPHLGRLLDRIAEAQAAGEVTDRSEALALAEELHRSSQ